MSESVAVWFTGPREVELRSEEIRSPGESQVLIRAQASGISHGTEMLVYRGEVDSTLSLDLPTLAGSFGFPIKYGYASVGLIESLGPDVAGFQPGDLVFCLHPHQSRYLAPIQLVTRLPSGLRPELGVFMANLTSALTILLDARVRLGEAVVVFGLGTVGQLLVQLLGRSGAQPIIGVDPVERRRSMALQLGAHDALLPGPGLCQAVRLNTNGRGADVAIEVSGAPSALQPAVDVVADEGTVVVASWYGMKAVSVRLGERFHRGRLHVRSSQVGRLDPALAPRWDRARRDELAAGLLQELTLEPLITHRIALESAPQAYRMLDEKPEEALQVIFSYER